ncbi:MAG: glycosyltransferase family 2 protein [Cyclobacteriaceae bacterium]
MAEVPKIPSVSVVMSTYNRHSIITEAIDSILNQTFTDFEFIIIDDRSTDDTWVSLQEIAKCDDRIIIARNDQNCGCNVSRNKAIDIAMGKYIAIVDDDDISKPERLKLQLNHLEDNPSTAVVGSQIQTFSEKNTRSTIYPSSFLIKKLPSAPDLLFEDVFLGKYVLPNPTLMFRADVLKRFKYPKVRYNGADVTLALQLAASGFKLDLIAQPLVLMRHGDGHNQMTSNIYKVMLGRRRRIRDILIWLDDCDLDGFRNLYPQALLNVKVKYLIELASRKSGIQRWHQMINAFYLNPVYVVFFLLATLSRRLEFKS